jgi:hypothetical protein
MRSVQRGNGKKSNVQLMVSVLIVVFILFAIGFMVYDTSEDEDSSPGDSHNQDITEQMIEEKFNSNGLVLLDYQKSFSIDSLNYPNYMVVSLGDNYQLKPGDSLKVKYEVNNAELDEGLEAKLCLGSCFDFFRVLDGDDIYAEFTIDKSMVVNELRISLISVEAGITFEVSRVAVSRS